MFVYFREERCFCHFLIFGFPQIAFTYECDCVNMKINFLQEPTYIDTYYKKF